MKTATLKDPREYVTYWLKANSIVINERGELIDELRRHNAAIFDTMWLDYQQQVRAHNTIEKTKAPNLRDLVNSVQEKDLLKALNELISLAQADYRRKSIEELAFTGDDQSELLKFVEAVTGNTNPAEVSAFAHWIWQIKRKMKGQDVINHLFIAIYGVQGGGKTVALNKLITPIKNYRLNLKMNQIVDDRYFFSMADNFVVIFDEMQGASRTDVDGLKNQITADWNDARRLGSNNVFKVRQSCSFAGTTNRPLNEMIFDSQMRRFWQCNALDKLNWELLNSIDFKKLWKGINESREEGYFTEQAEAIRDIQEELATKEDIDVFMAEFLITKPNGISKELSSKTLYNIYRSWCNEQGFQPNKILNETWFGRRLSNRGVKKLQKTFKGKTYRYYLVNANCQVQDYDPVARFNDARPYSLV